MRWWLDSVAPEFAHLMENNFKASARLWKGYSILPFPQSKIFLRTMLIIDRFKAPEVLAHCVYCCHSVF